MSELDIRRIVIACDAASDIRVAVEAAAALAERWNAALHGIFLEDENLYRLAGLPFGRQVTLSSAVSEALSADDLGTLFSALGAGMRRMLSEAAAQRGLAWSFGTVRDLPTAAALAGVEGDILVVPGAERAFSGSWRPRSAWDSLPEAYARTVLIRRAPRTGAGTVLILPGKGEDRERTLLSGLAMAGAEDDILVLLRHGTPADLEAGKQVAAPTLAQGRKVRWEAAAPDMPALLRRIVRLGPALIVVAAGDTDGPALRDLLDATRCDVLLVR